MLALALASIALTLVAQRDAIQPLDALPLHDRLANAAQAYVAYLGDLIVPVGLVVFRPRGPPRRLDDGARARAAGPTHRGGRGTCVARDPTCWSDGPGTS